MVLGTLGVVRALLLVTSSGVVGALELVMMVALVLDAPVVVVGDF